MHYFRLKVLILIYLTLMAVFSHKLYADGHENVFTFGVVPQQAGKELVRLWTPVLRIVGHEVGATLNFETAPNIPEFERRLARGEYDFAYMNPYHYTVFHDTPGYLVFARQEDKALRGLIVVRQDSPLVSLDELDGKDIAFPAPAAFAATVITQAHLDRRDINYTPLYVGSHDSVYRNVVSGLTHAGGGINRTLNTVSRDIREKLKVLWLSESYTPHAFAAHPRVPDKMVSLVQKALIGLKDIKRGREVLDQINFSGIVKAQDAEWDMVRELDISILNDAE
ncbi:phosphate/phosphite/phosphonate ABC transporter substrate-binding protein [Neptuniibacter sp. SY11_33]|uniref:phosphate/phosphite/phosphonate ABC transporter substrate-binding protein n=1 Tax=Neptuniibacter sp. SY11_33 TaxID=3398215 RepID=UPI0039F517EE